MSFSDWLWAVSSPNGLFYSLEKKKGKIVLPVCLLSGVLPQTPAALATPYQRPDC